MLTIDGSTLEGGGQLTRLTLALAAITRTPVRIHSIRAGRASKRSGGAGAGTAMGREQAQTRTRNRDRDRSRDRRGRNSAARSSHDAASSSAAGGLKDSHLAALEFLAEHCGARVEGAEVGSTQVVFRPLQPKNGVMYGPGARFGDVDGGFFIRLKKPGSVWLIFQAVFPFLVFETDWTSVGGNENKVKNAVVLSLAGGTNVPKAMSSEYMAQVFAPIAEKIGLPRIEIETMRRGWASTPAEIGEVKVRIHRPVSSPLTAGGRFVLPSFSIADRGAVSRVDITVVAHPISTCEKLVQTLSTLLGITFPNVPIYVVVNESSGDDRRLYILLVTHTSNGWRLGRDFLGSARGKNVAEAKRKIDEACTAVVKGLERELARDGCVDKHMQDQLVGFQALAAGKSTVFGGDLQLKQLDGGGKIRRIDASDLCVDEDGNEVDGEKVGKVGDESGTLHTRTVRWVCEKMLEEHGVRFEEGGICSGAGWNRMDGGKNIENELDLQALKICDDDNDDR